MERDSVQNVVGVNAVDDVRDKEETEEEAMERYFQEIDDMLDDPERIEANERWTERVQAAKEGVDEMEQILNRIKHSEKIYVADSIKGLGDWTRIEREQNKHDLEAVLLLNQFATAEAAQSLQTLKAMDLLKEIKAKKKKENDTE